MKAGSIIVKIVATILILWAISAIGSVIETTFRVGIEAPIAVNQVEDSAEPYVAVEGARKIGKLIPVIKVILSLLVLFLMWRKDIRKAAVEIKKMEG